MTISRRCADFTMRAAILKLFDKFLRQMCAGKSSKAFRIATCTSRIDNVLGRFFARLFGDFEDWHSEPSELFELKDRVIAIGTYSARAKATGRVFKARFTHVWTIRDGVIVRLQHCADTAQLARALGKNFSEEQTWLT